MIACKLIANLSLQPRIARGSVAPAIGRRSALGAGIAGEAAGIAGFMVRFHGSWRCVLAISFSILVAIATTGAKMYGGSDETERFAVSRP
jgi:hypothetical protein